MRLADHVAGVVHRRGERHARPERVLEHGDARIRMDEHGIEVPIDDGARALVVMLLIGAAIDEDVAHARDDERLGAQRGIEQRHELAAELPAAEREELDHEHRRRERAKRLLNRRCSGGAGLVDRARGIERHQTSIDVLGERRQLDDLHRRRRLQPRRLRSSGEQHDSKVGGERSGQRPRALQMSEAERVLAVHQQRVACHVRTTSAQRASARARCRAARASPSARTARAACRAFAMRW